MTLFLNSLIKDSMKIVADNWPVDETDWPPIVAFSGGKDSIVMADLISKMPFAHVLHYYVSTIEPPDVVRFMRKHYPQVQFIKPIKTPEQLVRMKGILPTRHMRFCCTYLREMRSPPGRTVFVGVRREESFGRRKTQAVRQHSRKRTIVCPIIHWASDEIWAYIHDNKLPYPSIYDEGYKRTGCIGCPLIHRRLRERDFLRYPRVKQRWFKMAEYVYGVLKENDRLRPEWDSVETYWEWWMDS